MPEIVRFTINQPVEVVLRRGGARRVEGHYGPQMMYGLVDDRVMYVPIVVADRIRESGISHGEPFEICKAEVKDGNRRFIEWRVTRITKSQSAISHATYEVRDHPNGKGNAHSNGTSRFEISEDGALLPVPIAGTAVTIMETALNAAAEIAQRVERRAFLHQRTLQFTSDDIRAIGLTMFIQASRDGGVRWDS